MDLIKKVTDFIMPPVDEEEELLAEENVATEEEQIQPEEKFVTRKVANGAPVADYTVSSFTAAAETHRDSKPHLTVHTTKIPELDVQIYVPKNFDQVTMVADDLKAGKAVVVNYERVDGEEQRRICDFVNGVCYVIDGAVKRVSDLIVLYVPEGVDIDKAMTASFL